MSNPGINIATHSSVVIKALAAQKVTLTLEDKSCIPEEQGISSLYYLAGFAIVGLLLLASIFSFRPATRQVIVNLPPDERYRKDRETDDGQYDEADDDLEYEQAYNVVDDEEMSFCLHCSDGMIVDISSADPRLISGILLGRNEEDNHIVIANDTVSGIHAMLRLDEEGNLVIIDLDSTNGTLVNGKKITPNVPFGSIDDGCTLTFGTYQIIFEAR